MVLKNNNKKIKRSLYLFLICIRKEIMINNNTHNNCYKCNSPIKPNTTLCNSCRLERNNAAAILATNKKALIKFLSIRSIDENRMYRFDRYVNNIRSKAEIILNYKKLKDNYIHNSQNINQCLW